MARQPIQTLLKAGRARGMVQEQSICLACTSPVESLAFQSNNNASDLRLYHLDVANGMINAFETYIFGGIRQKKREKKKQRGRKSESW